MVPIRVHQDGEVRIVVLGPMGPYGNNAYLLRDVAAGRALLVDMPLEPGPLLDAIAAEGGVETIVVTHWHLDHWGSYDEVRAATAAPVLVGAKEERIPPERIDGRLEDGQELRVGQTRVEVLHTPGHTGGSISLRVGGAVITGDTLFAGGPGKTFAAGDLETLLETIASRLLPLPEATLVLPGHGPSTTIAESRVGAAALRRRPPPRGTFGDVVWPAL